MRGWGENMQKSVVHPPLQCHVVHSGTRYTIAQVIRLNEIQSDLRYVGAELLDGRSHKHPFDVRISMDSLSYCCDPGYVEVDD